MPRHLLTGIIISMFLCRTSWESRRRDRSSYLCESYRVAPEALWTQTGSGHHWPQLAPRDPGGLRRSSLISLMTRILTRFSHGLGCCINSESTILSQNYKFRLFVRKLGWYFAEKNTKILETELWHQDPTTNPQTVLWRDPGAHPQSPSVVLRAVQGDLRMKIKIQSRFCVDQPWTGRCPLLETESRISTSATSVAPSSPMERCCRLTGGFLIATSVTSVPGGLPHAQSLNATICIQRV